MASFFTLWRLFLAQAESSDVTGFFGQISGLVGLTCVAGIIWVGLTAIVLQRAAERRRRAAQGLEPLPALYTSVWRALRGERNRDQVTSTFTSSDALPRPLPSAARPVAPAPDLALLTGDLPAPVLEPVHEALDAPSLDAALDSAWDDSTEESQLASAPVPAESAAEPADAIELLRVWRDLSSGALIMEIGGRRFQSVEELRSADLERRFSGVVHDLSALIQRPAAASGVSMKHADEVPATPRAGSAFRQIGRAALGQTPAAPAEIGPRSIADQIEELLQDRLASLPAFRERAIHVRPSLQGGVQIVVDDRQFEGVGEIEDPEVRALLEDVVREWEATQ